MKINDRLKIIKGMDYKKIIALFKILDGKQIVGLIVSTFLLYILLSGLFNSLIENGINAKFILAFFFYFILIYVIVRFNWLLGSPIDDEIKFNDEAFNFISNGVCPLCCVRKISSNKLKIGYRKRYWDIHYNIFSISYAHSTAELFTRIHICSDCSNKYKCNNHTFGNPSKKLLKRKYGFKRGIIFPYLSSNITTD